MFYLDTNTQKRYTIGRPFEYNGVTYTKVGASHDTFISLGFTQVIPQQRPDDRFYVVSGPAADGSYSSTPRNLDELKLSFIIEQKDMARKMMSGSDWYILRRLEMGLDSNAAVPASITAYRSDVRTAADNRCSQINSCPDVATLEALVKAPSEIYDVANETYVENPEPHLFEFPTPVDTTALVATDYTLPYSGGY